MTASFIRRGRKTSVVEVKAVEKRAEIDRSPLLLLLHVKHKEKGGKRPLNSFFSNDFLSRTFEITDLLHATVCFFAYYTTLLHASRGCLVFAAFAKCTASVRLCFLPGAIIICGLSGPYMLRFFFRRHSRGCAV